MTKSLERQSNFELLKIIAMLMIVAHHFVAKNFYNVDTEIIGLTINKVFLQFFGNQAFIGNNLFFMCSAWFLIDKRDELAGFPASSFKRIWKLEKAMLFYGIIFWIVFKLLSYEGATISLLLKSIFPLSTNLWWYPTCYAVFLLIHPFYRKGLQSLKEDELKKMLVVMGCVWSVSTLIPVFDYGASNFLCFVMLYAFVYYRKHFSNKYFDSKRFCVALIVTGYLLVLLSVVVLDSIGIRFSTAGQYACYYLRGNYRLFPMIISIAVFELFKDFRINSGIINYIASLTFGVYLIHMYPSVRDYMFSSENAVFRLDNIIRSPFLPLIALGEIMLCYCTCMVIEAIRQIIFKCMKSIIKGIKRRNVV